MAMKEFPRKGAWCVLGGKVGIIAELPYVERTHEEQPDPEDAEKTIRVPKTIMHHDKAEVHIVDEKGETVTVERAVPLESLVMATFDEIPEARRPEPKRGRDLGYAGAAELVDEAADVVAAVRATDGE